MARWCTPCCVLLALTAVIPTAAMRQESSVQESLGDESLDESVTQSHLILCHADVVAETCEKLASKKESEQVDDFVFSDDVQLALAATFGSTAEFYADVLGVSDLATAFAWGLVSCQELCDSAAAFLTVSGDKYIVPEWSNVGCYYDEAEVHCDLDLSAAALPVLNRDADLPDFDGVFGNPMEDGSGEELQVDREELFMLLMSDETATLGGGADPRDDGLKYDSYEFAARVLNLFRVYPIVNKQPSGGSILAEVAGDAQRSKVGGHTGAAATVQTTTDANVSATGGYCSYACHSEKHCYHESCQGCKFCDKSQPTDTGSTVCQYRTWCKSNADCDELPSLCRGCPACQRKPAKKPTRPKTPTKHSIGRPAQNYGGNIPSQPSRPTTNYDTGGGSGGSSPDYEEISNNLGNYLCQSIDDCRLFRDTCRHVALCKAPVVPSRPVYQAPLPTFTTPVRTARPVRTVDRRPRWQVALDQRRQQSIVYVNAAIRQFRATTTDSILSYWFGANTVSNSVLRGEVQRILNSVKTVLETIEFVFEGDQCEPDTYAYVYSRGYDGHSDAGRKTRDGKYIMNLCQLYMDSDDALQVETIVHEAAHHAIAYLDDVCADELYGGPDPRYEETSIHNLPDGTMAGSLVYLPLRGGGQVACRVRMTYQDTAVLQIQPRMGKVCRTKAYGRDTCHKLGIKDALKAVRNADNFCYFVQDVTDR